MQDSEGNKVTAIADVGEFGLITRLMSSFELKNKRVLKGVGDDCAVIEKNENEVSLITTDILAEGIHFDLTYVPLRHLGYKAAVVNFSDVYAMNGTPKFITVSIAISARFSVEAIEEIYAGIRSACTQYNVDLVGGDTSSSKGGMFMSITCVGEALKSKVVYRSGAKEKDIICVSGDLGGAFAGLQVLEREKRVYTENPNVQPDLYQFEYVVGRQLKPEARKDVLAELEKNNIEPTSMIDISDGLASELHHLCGQSSTGARIFWNKIPVDFQVDQAAELMNSPVSAYVLYGGEDYELLFTIKPTDAEKMKQVTSCKMIGFMDPPETGLHLVLADGSFAEIKAQGFNHFNKT